jgi:hypothetical protein
MTPSVGVPDAKTKRRWLNASKPEFMLDITIQFPVKFRRHIKVEQQFRLLFKHRRNGAELIQIRLAICVNYRSES